MSLKYKKKQTQIFSIQLFLFFIPLRIKQNSLSHSLPGSPFQELHRFRRLNANIEGPAPKNSDPSPAEGAGVIQRKLTKDRVKMS